MPTTAVKEAAKREPGTSEVTARELIEGLNRDLAGEFQAILTYRLFASMVGGPHRRELRSFFESEIPDELGHAATLADKIVALGGEPVTEPLPVEVSHDPRRMLEIALQAEAETIGRYEDRIREADQLGQTGLRVVLEDFVADETNHKEEIERILAGWKD